jgi:endonuclease/exonuclease/phosphatase family metal-dependent hydrolase
MPFLAMRRIASFSAGILLCLAGCPGTQRDLGPRPVADAEPDPPDVVIDVEIEPVTVRVVNWNVLNLFNDVRDSLELEEANEMILTTDKYQAKLDAVAGVLAQLDPDLAMLQEVENPKVLGELADRLGSYPHLKITAGNDPRGIDIALLSRYPIEKLVSHTQDEFQSSAGGQSHRFARDVLEAHLTINGRPVVLLGIHLKSGLEAFDMDKRLAEAERVRAIADRLESEEPRRMILVLGDFNAVPGEPPLQALAAANFASVTAGLPAAERYSVTFGGQPKLFDDQLADPDGIAMLDASSVKILHSSDADLASDHDPVFAAYLVR